MGVQGWRSTLSHSLLGDAAQASTGYGPSSSRRSPTVRHTVFVYTNYVNWRCFIRFRRGSAAPLIVLTTSQGGRLGGPSCDCSQSKYGCRVRAPSPLSAQGSVIVTSVCSGMTVTHGGFSVSSSGHPCKCTPRDRGQAECSLHPQQLAQCLACGGAQNRLLSEGMFLAISCHPPIWPALAPCLCVKLKVTPAPKSRQERRPAVTSLVGEGGGWSSEALCNSVRMELPSLEH